VGKHIVGEIPGYVNLIFLGDLCGYTFTFDALYVADIVHEPHLLFLTVTHLHLYSMRADTVQVNTLPPSKTSSAVHRRHATNTGTGTYHTGATKYRRKALPDGPFWRAVFLVPMITAVKR
jgi:hypothetical protein